VEFVIARNPDGESSLPYLVRLPLGQQGVVLKVRDTWPRTAKVYCHRAEGWPDDADIVERVPVRSCIRRGASIDLVLERGRENRSQFVFAMARGREVIFWQSARTAKQAKPVAVPTARASGRVLEIVVDSHERYPWTFSAQQATTRRQALPSGDYAVTLDGRVIASVERKSLADLVGTLTSGKLRYLMADLATVPRAALVIEDRWSSVFKLDRVRPSTVTEGLAEAQVRFPTVPIVFCETRQLAQEWAYRGPAGPRATDHRRGTGMGGGRRSSRCCGRQAPTRHPRRLPGRPRPRPESSAPGRQPDHPPDHPPGNRNRTDVNRGISPGSLGAPRATRG
jgi:hypothetical protein